jgi:PAS domain S-box-containing protein
MTLTQRLADRCRDLAQLLRDAASLVVGKPSLERFTINASPMLLVDPADARIVDANAAASAFFGYSRAHMTTLRIHDLATIGRELVAENLAKSIRGELGLGLFVVRLADGSTRDVQVSAGGLRFGGRTLLFCVLADVSAREDAERAIRAAERKQAAMISNISDVIALVSREGKVLFTSANVEAIFGWKTEECVGGEIGGRVHPEDRAGVQEAFVELLKQGGATVTCECRLLRKDGSYAITWIASTNMVDDPDIGAILVNYRDITQRKRSEADRERLLAAVEQSDESIVITDVHGSIQYVNPCFERVTGYGRDEVLGRNPRVLKSGRVEPSTYRALWATLSAGRTWKGTLVNRRKDGRLFTEDATISPVRDSSGTVVNYVAVKYDISARLFDEALNLQRQMEGVARAQELAAQANAANEAKGAFLATMSHEIRTPLNGILGMTHLLLDTDLSPEQRSYAEMAAASGGSLLALINQVLDFSKIEAGRLDLEAVDFELESLLNDFVPAMRIGALAKGLELSCVQEDGVPTWVRGDPGRLRQVLTNLVSNAIKFTRAGSVKVRVSLQERGRGDCLLRFSVRDTGVGIEPGKQKLLFQKFSQVDSSFSREKEGSGLGLAISKELAELMGGHTGMSSQPGLGSEFWFTARLGTVAAKVAGVGRGGVEQGRDLAARFRGCTARILVAEDNATNQLVALGLLKKLGLRSDAVANGLETLRALESIPYDLVLMDVHMPEMDGFEATRAVRDPGSAVLDHGVPIVAMTANAMQGDRERCLRAGMDDYLSKPISAQALAEVLEAWLKKAPAKAWRSPGAPAHTRGAGGSQAFDRAGLMQRVEDEPLAAALISSFELQFPGLAASLRERIRSGDAQEAQAVAHQMKGAAANVGAELLRALAQRMEDAGRARDLGELVRLLPQLDLEFEGFRAAADAEALVPTTSRGGKP